MEFDDPGLTGGSKDDCVPALGINRLPERSCGTTLIAVEFKDGLVVGTDSRTSTGSFVASRATDKITPLTDHMVVLRSGSAADTQAIADIVKYHMGVKSMMERAPMTVYRTAQLFRQFLYDYRDDMSGSAIIAGFDQINGPQLYAIPLGGYIIRQKCAASGGGSTYVQGFMDSAWKADMDVNAAVEMVKNAVCLATLRDGSSGGVIRLAIITKDGVERKLLREDKGTFPTFEQPKAYPTFPTNTV